MPNWSQVLTSINKFSDTISELDKQRDLYLKRINDITGRNVIAYYSGWLKKPDAPHVEIDDVDKNAFMNAVHGLDRSKGLDIILHTPGGDIAATESLVQYLKSMFNSDIRAIIPQISMSAGTMIALSCKEIVMGEHSSLGPIDPQMGGVPCQGIIEEFNRALSDVTANPATASIWQVIIGKYHPTFLNSCENAIRWSEQLAKDWLQQANPNLNIQPVMDMFLDHNNSFSHSRHISKSKCKSVGLNIVDLESDNDLQEAVLSLHHCYMILMDKCRISKVVENQNCSRYLQQYGD